MKDKALVWKPSPWFLPVVGLVKSGTKNRWCLVFRLDTDETEKWPRYTFTWFLQLRPWWPPIFFFRGWIKWEGA